MKQCIIYLQVLWALNPKVRNTVKKEKKKKGSKVSHKQFGTNGASLRVKREGLPADLYVQHLID